MIFVSADKLKPGMILAMDLNVYNKYTFKTLLLREGQYLNQTYINKILSNNISGAYIKNEGTSHNNYNNVINEELESDLLMRIKDIYYKYKLYSYKIDKKLIWDVYDLADDLIEETIINKTLNYKMLHFNNLEDYIFQHCLNVTILSISLGNSLELSEIMIRDLATAALLHDIGMMKISDEILNKTNLLTVEEFKVIKNHTVYAVNDLRHFVSNDILRGIAGHHEHVDGTGYPYGLAGNQIHIFGKILTICDVYQSLSTDVVSRNAWRPKQVVQYLIDGKNIKFDEHIIDTFLRNKIVYEPGEIVKLTDKRTGIVIENNPNNCLKPIVQIINPDDSEGDEIDLMDYEDIEINEKGHNFQYIVSACLCGEKTRYDGKSSISHNIKKLVAEGKAIMVCPEVLGGLKVPRLPCEIKNGRVINITSDDKTENFVEGAIKTLEIAKKYNIKKALLKEKSPSCGSKFIYDGTFSKNLIPGEGITTRLLRLNEIEVISDEDY